MNQPQGIIHNTPANSDVLDTQDADFELLEDGEENGKEDSEEDSEEEYEAEYEEEDEIAPALPAEPLDAEEKARLMAAAADAVRAEDIVVLDLRPLTIIADFFLICTGKSSIQLRAIADRIEEKLRDAGLRKPRTQGYQEGTWILLDFGDVVAHLMAAEQRAFYRLEEFWDAAPRLTLELLPEEDRSTRPTPTRFETLTPPETEDENHEDAAANVR